MKDVSGVLLIGVLMVIVDIFLLCVMIQIVGTNEHYQQMTTIS